MPERTENSDLDGQQTQSKSARKRHMLKLQSMGESLLSLNDKQLAQIPLDDQPLLTAIQECRKIRSNSARKRQIQLIGKLMRSIDVTAIEQALLCLHHTKQQDRLAHHRLEQLRTQILDAGSSGVEIAIARFPEADRQHLRQLVLQHQREIQRQKPLAASRKLFRYLKALQDNAGLPD